MLVLEVKGAYGPRLLTGSTSGLLDFILRALAKVIHEHRFFSKNPKHFRKLENVQDFLINFITSEINMNIRTFVKNLFVYCVLVLCSIKLQ